MVEGKLRNFMKETTCHWFLSGRKNDRKILIEKNEVILLRINYLRSIKQYTEHKRKIVYTDETYLYLSFMKEHA